jgi:hypothetical protein
LGVIRAGFGSFTFLVLCCFLFRLYLSEHWSFTTAFARGLIRALSPSQWMQAGCLLAAIAGFAALTVLAAVFSSGRKGRQAE